MSVAWKIQSFKNKFPWYKDHESIMAKRRKKKKTGKLRITWAMEEENIKERDDVNNWVGCGEAAVLLSWHLIDFFF